MPPTPTTATSGQRIVDCGHLHYVRLRQVYAAPGSSASFDLPRTYLYYVRLRQAYVVLGSSAPFELPHAYLFALGLATRPALADSLWAPFSREGPPNGWTPEVWEDDVLQPHQLRRTPTRNRRPPRHRVT